MAFMDQKKKKALEPGIKAICTEYGVKLTLSVRNHMVLVATLREGPIDFVASYQRIHGDKFSFHRNVSTHWLDKAYDGTALEFLTKLHAAMNEGNHDRSDAMTDHFDVGWYVDIDIGTADKPYVCTEPEAAEPEVKAPVVHFEATVTLKGEEIEAAKLAFVAAGLPDLADRISAALKVASVEVP